MTEDIFMRLYIYATSACIYRCSHCFVSSKRKYIKPDNIDPELVRQFILDFGKHAKACNITGEGLPVLHPQLKDIIRICKQYIGHVSINTRGLIKPDLLDFFKTMDVVVYYSMDWFGKKADEEMRYNGLWEQQVFTLKNMLNRGIRVAIRTTIMRNNFGDVLQLISLVERLRLRGYDIVIEMMPFLPYHLPENMPSVEQIKLITSVALSKNFTRLLTAWWRCIYPDFRDRASRWWDNIDGGRLCEAGRLYGRLAIKQDGSVLPCPFETKSIGKYEKILGKWVIDKRKLHINRNEYLNSGKIDEKCKKCIFFRYCGGGCRVVSNLNYEQVCPIPNLWR